MRWQDKKGFTIVELLIVVVVVSILAAITVVAYNGIQDRARASQAASVLTQAAKKVSLWQVEHGGEYPVTLSDVELSDTNTIAYQYSSDNGVNPATFCVSATIASKSYYRSSANSDVQSGICPGHNLLVWAEPDAATKPIPAGTIDTTVYRNGSASIRLNPGQAGLVLAGNPYAGTTGQVYTVSLWLRTDSNWNGLGNNSKIRFGNGTDGSGSLLHSCSYNGVKTNWTLVTCSYTLTASVTSVQLSVGNDGTVGNIWIDDLTVSRT